MESGTCHRSAAHVDSVTRARKQCFLQKRLGRARACRPHGLAIGGGNRARDRDTTGDGQLRRRSIRTHNETSPMPSASRAAILCGAVVAVVLAPFHSPVAAQATPMIPIGAHLRVRGQGNHAAVFTGRLRMINDDSIALALDDDSEQTVLLAFSEIGRAEREHDEKTRDEAASAMGAVGAVGGLTAAVYWCVHNQSAARTISSRCRKPPTMMRATSARRR